MAYAGTVHGAYGTVQLHTLGRYNKVGMLLSRNGTKIRTVLDFSLYRTGRCLALHYARLMWMHLYYLYITDKHCTRIISRSNYTDENSLACKLQFQDLAKCSVLLSPIIFVIVNRKTMSDVRTIKGQSIENN